MTNTKVTKVEAYEAIFVILKDANVLEHLIDRINKDTIQANKKKSTAENKEHTKLMNEIVNALTVIGKPACISDMKEVSEIIAPLNSQRISAMCSKLIEKGVISKDTIKKVTYFALIENADED